MDYFKIVATQEKQGIYFTVVPHQWEAKGILFWPEHLSHSPREVLRSNAATVPEEDWKKYPCIVKCTGVSNFKQALKLEKELSQCIDTDAEEALFEEMNSRKRSKHANISQQLTDRNDLFIERNQINETPAASSSQVAEPVYNSVVFEPSGSIDLGDVSVLNVAPFSNNNEDFAVLKEEFRQLRNDFETFKDDLKREIKEDFAKINLSLDRIFRIISTKELPQKELETSKGVNDDLLKEFTFPLSSCDQILLLENRIRQDLKFRNQLIEFLSKISGRTGMENGSKVAYKLVDCLFKPDVLTQYSWTGVARGSAAEKKSFQVLDGIIDVFFEVILLADNRHTKKNNCAFFKDGILKHAKKRSARKQSRSISNTITPEEARVIETNGDTDGSQIEPLIEEDL